MNRTIILILAAAVSAAVVPVSAQTPAAGALFGGAAALGYAVPAGELPRVALPGALVPPRAAVTVPGALPENCANMPVLYVRNGDLYKNGDKLGPNVASYKGACSGEAAWRDTYGRLYKDRTELGRSVSDFRIALYTGDVVWTDGYGRLHKNRDEVGSAQVFLVADWTGDVAWRDGYGRLYKNARELGSANRFQLAGHTGDVVWVDNYGTLHKNQDKLGDSDNYFVAERTGDVAWLDHYSNLYLNKTRVSTSCQRFELREDGKLLWVDNFGEYHYLSAERFDAVSKPAAARGIVMLIDPRTGKAQPVVQVAGGFIYASTGQFVAAVFNGSGYVLPGGQFYPVAGGRASSNPGNKLTGKWTGWGEWTYQGSGTRCDSMTLTFEDGPEYLDRRGGYFDCGFVALASEPGRWLKRGTDLLDGNGAVAGSYENGRVTLIEAYGENVEIVTKIKVDGLHFDYSEVWTEKSGRPLYFITGRLFTGGN